MSRAERGAPATVVLAAASVVVVALIVGVLVGARRVMVDGGDVDVVAAERREPREPESAPPSAATATTTIPVTVAPATEADSEDPLGQRGEPDVAVPTSDAPTADGPTADDSAPSAPRNLVAVVEASGDVTLSWDESSDDGGVTGYQVLHNGVEIGTAVTPGFVVSAPAVGSHWYQVRALDAAGNESRKTPPVQVDIDGPDVLNPWAPQDLVAVVEADGVMLSWEAPVDNVGVIDYQVLLDGVEIGTTESTTFDAPPPEPGSQWYQVRARDAAGNESRKSAPVRVHIGGPGSERPSAPLNLAAVVEADGDVTLTWEAAPDNVGAMVYQVLRNGSPITVTAGFTFVVRSPAAGSHWYQVRAIDVARTEGYKTAPVRVDID